MAGADTPIDLPITAVRLITEITRFTLDLAPYLELMDEIGLTLSRRQRSLAAQELSHRPDAADGDHAGQQGTHQRRRPADPTQPLLGAWQEPDRQ